MKAWVWFYVGIALVAMATILPYVVVWYRVLRSLGRV